MAAIAGLPYFDNYLYSQILPVLNSSICHDVFVMRSWYWTLAEIRYQMFMICHELQAFKTCGGQELAGHRLSS